MTDADADVKSRKTTLETASGQMAPPKSGHPVRMPPGSGGILRGGPLLGGETCPNVVSRAGTSAG